MKRRSNLLRISPRLLRFARNDPEMVIGFDPDPDFDPAVALLNLKPPLRVLPNLRDLRVKKRPVLP